MINHKNVVKMFKTQAGPQAAGEWFHYKILNILTSFLEVQTMENCWFVFYKIL